MNIDEKRSYLTTLDLMMGGLESHAKDRGKALRKLGVDPTRDKELDNLWAARGNLSSAKLNIGQIEVEEDY